LSHADALKTAGLNNTNFDSKTDRVGYEAVAQKAVKEASVAERQLFAVLVARKVYGPASIAAITLFARDSIGV
jgi:hypothetical protein